MLHRIHKCAWRAVQIILLSIVLSLLVTAETYVLHRLRQDTSDHPIWEATKKSWSVSTAYTWLSNGTRLLYLGVSIAVLMVHG